MPALLPVPILLVDDEEAILNAYDELLNQSAPTENAAALNALKGKLFAKAAPAAAAVPEPHFEIHHGRDAVQAVEVFEAAMAQNIRFAVVVLDMRMPPGPHGAWAAVRIRALDSDVRIIIATAFSDVDPDKLVELAPPKEKLFYVPKPFQPDEIRKLVIECSRAWVRDMQMAA